MSYWVGWLRSVGHAEEKKEKKDTKAIRSKEQKKRRFWLKQSQSKWLEIGRAHV